ncbi:MAG: alanyl-tRNA editing protein AlaX [Desulfurococcales archaeon ex4484_42]|nr:MAG: alanyl-tRNA editing protein AlaX [Desulfurococcales archaeon ex4484_42]
MSLTNIQNTYSDDVRTHTALHVLKGAIVKVLGKDAMWTASTYVSGKHGRLTVKFNRKPSNDEIKAIEELANKKIKEDLRVEVKIMPRDEAERTYGNIIYDLFPVPKEVKELSIVIVYDSDGSIWNINACNKEHCKTISCVGEINIKKVRFRKSKQLLEISFDIEP